jgi:hypothetical protein
VCYGFPFSGGDPLKRENVKERVLMWRGVAGCPRRVGSGIKIIGAADNFYGAREGAALPLNEFDFNAFGFIG